MSDFDRFAAMSFDCYGTLIDWETGIANALRPWAAGNGLTLDDQALIAAHGRHETHVQDDMPGALYPMILAETLRRIGAELRAPVTDSRRRRLRSIGEGLAGVCRHQLRAEAPVDALQADHRQQHRQGLRSPPATRGWA